MTTAYSISVPNTIVDNLEPFYNGLLATTVSNFLMTSSVHHNTCCARNHEDFPHAVIVMLFSDRQNRRRNEGPQYALVEP
jgi:hypothetical protein